MARNRNKLIVNVKKKEAPEKSVRKSKRKKNARKLSPRK